VWTPEKLKHKRGELHLKEYFSRLVSELSAAACVVGNQQQQQQNGPF
jgi:hypothetical protein